MDFDQEWPCLGWPAHRANRHARRRNLPLAKMKQLFYFLSRTEFVISSATAPPATKARVPNPQTPALRSQDSPERRGASGKTRCHRTPPVEERLEMRKILYAAAMTVLMASPALAENIGVSMAKFDDNFLTVLRNGMQDYADRQGRREPAGRGRAERRRASSSARSRTSSPRASMRSSSTRSTPTRPPAMTKLAVEAGIPLVYVNRMPVRQSTLPAKVAFVGSNEVDSGTLEMQEVCKLHGRQGQHPGHDGRAVQPGRAPAHPGHPRRDRQRPMRGHQDRRGADRQLGRAPRAPT